MNNRTLVVIAIQNDITKHYRDIIENINCLTWSMTPYSSSSKTLLDNINLSTLLARLRGLYFMKELYP